MQVKLIGLGGGNYTYLNKQEAYSLANWFRNKQRDLANTANASAFGPVPLIAIIPGVWSVFKLLRLPIT